MIMQSVQQFRDFLLRRIDKTRDAKKLSDDEKQRRIESLNEILELEILDPVYNRFDTMWLVEKIKEERSTATLYLENNTRNFDEMKDKLKSINSQIMLLEQSLASCKKREAEIVEEDFIANELRENREEIEEELAKLKKEAGVCKNLMKMKSYYEHLLHTLSHLLGILMNPNYFSYLK